MGNDFAFCAFRGYCILWNKSCIKRSVCKNYISENLHDAEITCNFAVKKTQRNYDEKRDSLGAYPQDSDTAKGAQPRRFA